MSSIKVTANNNTNTSTSRRGKNNSQAVVSNVEVANEETKVTVESVAAVVDVQTDQNETVSDETPSVSTETVKPPPVNFWKEKMRLDAETAVQKAKEALQAAEAAKLATEKAITSVVKSGSNFKSGSSFKSAKVEAAAAEAAAGEGWEKVSYKRNKGPFKGKPVQAHAQTRAQHTNTRAQTETQNQSSADVQTSQPTEQTKDRGEYKPREQKDREYKPREQKDRREYKPRERKEPSEEQVAYRVRKAAALEIAQKAMVQECVRALPSHVREDVNNQLRFVINYSKTLVVDVSQDLPVQHEGETFQFSRERFFENRFFQNHVRDEFTSLVPDGWLRFFPGRNEGTYCISIKLRRD